jgi:hypothetical protein
MAIAGAVPSNRRPASSRRFPRSPGVWNGATHHRKPVCRAANAALISRIRRSASAAVNRADTTVLLNGSG